MRCILDCGCKIAMITVSVSILQSANVLHYMRDGQLFFGIYVHYLDSLREDEESMVRKGGKQGPIGVVISCLEHKCVE